jgi:ketosteroid isomerase-like protein
MSSMEVNRADVLEEVRALCAAYDRALLDNDVAALVEFFWDDGRAMRLGVTEELYGAEEISAFRKSRIVNFADRTNLRETLVTFGDSFASSAVEFSVTVAGAPRHGRQSQIWVRFPDLGWKIVSAHVSHKVTPTSAAAFGQSKAAAYAAAAAALLDMPVAAQHAPGVAHDLDVMSKIVGPLMALDLSDIEPAPVFTA